MSKDISIKAGANLNLKGLASTELEVAKISLDQMSLGKFLITPHEIVKKYIKK